ncbi:hypothetical protein Tco_0888015, partial [Tanacetum coccineum]
MDTTRAQQQALDDELVAPADRLKIGKSNLRLSSILKSKEPTLQVALDALKLTPFYNAFEISADVPEIYMQEFWVTVSRHHSSLRFKLNGKSHTVNVDNFRDMLKICPKLLGYIFEEPTLEEVIISFIRDLGHTEGIKFLSDVNVNHMHQPWRSLLKLINNYVDYVYLLWEDLVYQVENKNSKKNNDMYYPRFTKVIVDYFMTKDQGIPRRNKMFWHYARDDFMFTIVRVISKHQDTQVYGTILPQHLTNQAMLESEAYMTYYAYATGEKTPKPKTTKKKADSESSSKTKSTQASKGKRITTLAKGDKLAKKKQSASKSKGLTVLSEVTLTEAQQLKIAIERSKIQTHSSHANGSGDGVDTQSKVPDEPQQNIPGTNEGAGEDDEENDKHDSEDDNDEHDSESDNDDEDDDQENVSGETQSDDDEDNFVHPNLSTYKADDQEKEKEEEKANDDDEVSSDQMVSTPPNYEIIKRMMVKLWEENKKMRKMRNCIDSILNTTTQSDIPVNVSVSVTTTTPSSDTTSPQTPILIIQPQQQTHDSITTTTIPATTLPNIPNFASVFAFELRVSSLKTELSELKQTNQFAEALSSILGIVDNYLASKMKDEVNMAIQLKLNKLREEAQVENDEFLKHIDSNIKAIIKD